MMAAALGRSALQRCRRWRAARQEGGISLTGLRLGLLRLDEARIEWRSERQVRCRRCCGARGCRRCRSRLQLAAPVDRVDVETERIASKSIRCRRRLEHDRQDSGPVRRSGLCAALVGGLDPFHLKGTIGGADHAGDLHRDCPFSHATERVCRAGIVSEEDGASLGREVIGRQPVLAHQDRIERYRPDARHEPPEEPCDLRIGWMVDGIGGRHGTGFAELVDLYDIGDDPALNRLPEQAAREGGGQAEASECHQTPVPRLHAGGADPIVPELTGSLEWRFGYGRSPIALHGTFEDHQSSLSLMSGVAPAPPRSP